MHDESGNTGANLLNRDQPYYYAGAIRAKESLDEKYKGRFETFAASPGHMHLHAAEMGMGKLIEFLPFLDGSWNVWIGWRLFVLRSAGF
jgi:hypothetical protein